MPLSPIAIRRIGEYKYSYTESDTVFLCDVCVCVFAFSLSFLRFSLVSIGMVHLYPQAWSLLRTKNKMPFIGRLRLSSAVWRGFIVVHKQGASYVKKNNAYHRHAQVIRLSIDRSCYRLFDDSSLSTSMVPTRQGFSSAVWRKIRLPVDQWPLLAGSH